MKGRVGASETLSVGWDLHLGHLQEHYSAHPKGALTVFLTPHQSHYGDGGFQIFEDQN